MYYPGNNCFFRILCYIDCMISITERCRKILRTIFRGIGVSAVSLIIQACYGVMPPEEESSISGKVVAKETGKPILGIQVSVEETEYWERTDKNGYFSFWVPIQEVYVLKFEDIDGPYNDGLFKQQIWTLKQDDIYKILLIGMDEDKETDTDTETDEE